MYSGIRDLFQKCIKIIDKKFYKYFYLYFFLSVIGGILETISIGMLIPILALVTDASVSNSSLSFFFKFINTLGFTSDNQQIIFLSISLIIIYILKNLFLGLIVNFQFNVTAKIQTELSNNLFDDYFKLSYEFHKKKNSSEVVRDVLGETTQFARGLVFNFLNLLLNFLLSLFIIIFLFLTEFNSTIMITFLSLIFGIIFLKFFKRKISKLGKDRIFYSKLQYKYIQEALGNFKEIKLMDKSKNIIENFKFYNAGVFEIMRKNGIINYIPRLIIEVLLVSLIVLVLIFYLKIGYDYKQIVVIIGILAACGIKLIPLTSTMINSLNLVIYSKPSANALFSYLKENKNYNKNFTLNNNYEFIENFENIEFKNISFKYSDENSFKLENISFNILKGDKVGIIGKTGSGKSTLLDLSLGLLKPQKGNILINGKELIGYNANWKNVLGYVPQNIYLLDDTILNNITLGDGNNYDEKIIESVLEKACINKFINNLPEKVNTVVGENGARISGGQKQRIGIARTLLKNNQLLVLDEATSAIDTKTESELIKNIFSTNETVIFVTHRLENLKYCNKIINLDNYPIIIENK